MDGYSGIEDFATELLEDERDSFSFGEAESLAKGLHVSTAKVVRELKEYGFRYEGRPVEKEIRGFTANPHNRWQGMGEDFKLQGSRRPNSSPIDTTVGLCVFCKYAT